jgi:hypothetical protein
MGSNQGYKAGVSIPPIDYNINEIFSKKYNDEHNISYKLIIN